MKLLLLIVILISSGCATGYPVGTTTYPKSATMPEYKIKVYESKVAMQNAYVLYNVNREEGKGRWPVIDRERVNGFFSYIDDTIHCYAPFPEKTIEHEKIHLKVKYGVVKTNHPHFRVN